MDALTQFNFRGEGIRTLTDEHGEPWFVLNDVCKVLDIANTRNVAERIDQDGVRKTDVIDSMGRTQQANAVNEPGLYEVIIRSNSPKAKPFKDWVLREVLPAIRKYGGYLTREATEAALADPDFIIKLATALKEERAKTAALTQQSEADRPKIIFAESVAASPDSILISELAKLLKQNGVETGGIRLYETLRSEGYLIRREGLDRNMPTQRAMELGLFEVRITAINNATDEPRIRKTVRVTGKGQQYFINRYAGKKDAA